MPFSTLEVLGSRQASATAYYVINNLNLVGAVFCVCYNPVCLGFPRFRVSSLA